MHMTTSGTCASWEEETYWCQVLGCPGKSHWNFSALGVRIWLILRAKSVAVAPGCLSG